MANSIEDIKALANTKLGFAVSSQVSLYIENNVPKSWKYKTKG